jgi:hypothetical protein
MRRSTLQLGAQGGEIEKREREKDLQAKSVDRIVCFHLIYYKAWLCGCSPRERVNHVYLVFCVIDVVFFFLGYFVIALLY